MNLDKYVKNSEIEKNYIITHKIYDDIFGELFIYQIKDNNEIIMSKSFLCENLNQLQKYLTEIKKKETIKHPNLLNLLDYSIKIIENNKFNITGFYYFPSKNLYHMIEEFKVDKNYLNINEVKKLFSDILNGLIFLEENKLIHGDIRPEYLAYNEITQNFIISDRFNYNLKSELQQYIYIKKNFDLYLSPILFKGILNKDRRINHNPFKSEIFSFGLVLLELILLKSIQNIYDYDKKIVNFNILYDYINEINNIYKDSKILINILNSMLRINENEILSSKELRNLFDTENLNIKNFNENISNDDSIIKEKLKEHKIIYKTDDGKIYTEDEYIKLKKSLNENSLSERTKLKKSHFNKDHFNFEDYKKTEANVIKEGIKYKEFLYKNK